MGFGDYVAKVFESLFGSPISAIVMTCCILLLLSPIYMPLLKKVTGKGKQAA